MLDGHAQRSGGAIPYTGFAEFEAAVELLRTTPELADALGAAGRRYVEREYDWDVVMRRYERIAGAGGASGVAGELIRRWRAAARRAGPRRAGDEVGEQADRDHLERGEEDQQRVGRDVEVAIR